MLTSSLIIWEVKLLMMDFCLVLIKTLDNQ